MTGALVDHLWQSTLFTLAAGLLTLALRRSAAGARYAVWLAASLKFLVPFALLTAMGGAAAQRLHLPVAPPHGLAAIAPRIAPVIEPMTFTDMTGRAAVPAALPAAAVPPTAPFDPAPLLLGLWALGAAGMLIVWAARWSRVRRVLRAATPAHWLGNRAAPVRALSSRLLLEPGVAGLWRPVLLLPHGIQDHLSSAELDAVIAHELCHIGRRDNLTGALHMAVQALFWFHPVVWWLGTRLVAERERACDEAVVRAGHPRATYARGILEICRLYLRSPLICVAGVSGSGLKKRVEDIMTNPESLPLSLAAKALLGGAAALALASPVAAGILAAQTPAQPLSQPAVPSMRAVPTPVAAKVVAAATAPAAQADPAPPAADPQQAEAPRPIVVAEAKAPAPVSPPAGASSDEAARRLAEQQQPRAVVPFDSTHFDRYVGYYQRGPGAIDRVWREGSKYFAQITGQPPVPLYPESETKFFTTVVAAQLSFDADAKGAVTGLVIHQNGNETFWPKVDDAVAKADEAALVQRIASKTPAPGSEASVRKWLTAMEAGQPDYEDMGPLLAQAARQQWPQTAPLFRGFGALKDVHFADVDPQGNDVYLADFQNGRVSVTIAPLSPDGKISGLFFRILP
jgi:beta-lactamase regulating signal transducer with metallopeptidase domain